MWLYKSINPLRTYSPYTKRHPANTEEVQVAKRARVGGCGGRQGSLKTLPKLLGEKRS